MDMLMQKALKGGDWYNASRCLQIMALYSLKQDLKAEVALISEHCKLTAIQKKVLENFADARS